MKLPKRTRAGGVILRVTSFITMAFGMQWALFKVSAPAGCTWSPSGYGETCTGVPHLLAIVMCLGTSFLAGIWCSWLDDKWIALTEDKSDEPPSADDQMRDMKQRWKRNVYDD